MPITELENGSESVLIKVFANKTSHFVASWYRPPDGKIEELELFKNQIEKVKTLHVYTDTNNTSQPTWFILSR